MANFVKFIEEDIEAKKTLFSTMPNKNKRDIKKFNEKIDSAAEKYNEYKKRLKKYIDTKSKSFDIKSEDKDIGKLNDNISSLEHVRFILNPSNTYFEKIGFDNLLFEISNYHNFNFKSLNDIIDQFLSKFELAGINLTSTDFDYTCYVHEYMTSFLEVRNKKGKNYDKVSDIFEKIYWVNPEIVQHIELNFRMLIKRNERKFNNYISGLQDEVMTKNNVSSYENCLTKLEDAYAELNDAEKENVSDIINLAKKGTIDINSYFEDSKVRLTTFESLMINPINFEEKDTVDKFYESLEKLKVNLTEYSNYMKFIPLFNNFRKEYEKQIPKATKDSNNKLDQTLKSIESQIAEKETKLTKINKKISKTEPKSTGSNESGASFIENKLGEINRKIFKGNLKFLEANGEENLKQLKNESINIAKELYELYKKHDNEFYNFQVLSILDGSLTISELLKLYYSFDFFKKIAIKRVFDVSTYKEIVEYSDSFDLFAMDTRNIVTNSVSLFNDTNVAKVIVNKYRLDNIDINEENLNPDDLNILLEKIQFLLRINEIENSSTDVEKIWFMIQVEEINKSESKKS